MLLGNNVEYPSQYNPDLLFAIPRQNNRELINLYQKDLPFNGWDIWNIYELSWLDINGKPLVFIGELIVPANSPNLIESKSLKLYFNSFNNEKFLDKGQVSNIVQQDIEAKINAPIQFNIYELNNYQFFVNHTNVEGKSIDDLEINNISYGLDPNILFANQNIVKEILYSNLLRSNCLITNQPDWGTIIIEYEGKQINHESLLRYIISYRNHNEFHEHCVERIFMDIMKQCSPDSLTVYARYTRRGGIDINPWRSNQLSNHLSKQPKNIRLIRQ